MKLYTGNPTDTRADAVTAAAESKAMLESRLQALYDRCREIDPTNPAWADAQLDIGHLLLRLERGAQAFEQARAAFDDFVARQDWPHAVEAAEVMYRSDTPLALPALGHGVWLAVTFPVDPEISIEMLRLVVEDTPDDSDGAAVAAATAHYLADIRSRDDKQRQNLGFYTGQLLSSVARRHSGIDSQEEFSAWVRRLELDEPDKFLIRLRNVVDILVQDDWWIDRDAIREMLPQ